MNNDLMLWATGEVAPRRADRPVARRAKAVYDDARVAQLKAHAVFALGADIMNQTAGLYEKGKALAGDDPTLGRILADELFSTVRAAQEIQSSLFEDPSRGRRGF